MSQDEVVAVMKARHEHYNLVNREGWEQTRLKCFYTVAAISGKVKRPKELFKLPWDDEKRQMLGEVKTRTKEEALEMHQEMIKSRQNGK
jgi:hypothetical protein